MNSGPAYVVTGELAKVVLFDGKKCTEDSIYSTELPANAVSNLNNIKFEDFLDSRRSNWANFAKSFQLKLI